jgi:hypothetical protein
MSDSLEETRAEIYSVVDDAWTRVFAMILGTPLPSKEAKEQFHSFVLGRMQETDSTRLTEEDVIGLLPEFLTETFI